MANKPKHICGKIRKGLVSPSAHPPAVGDDEEVPERGGGAGECAESPPEPLRHLKHLVGMLSSSHSSTFFRYHSFSPESRYMIAPAPQFRQYPKMGGPLTEISEESWGDMAISFDDVKRARGRFRFQRLSKGNLQPRPKASLTVT